MHLAAGHTETIVDLASLTGIDAAGLGEIVQCRTAVLGKNGVLKLRNLTKWVHGEIEELQALGVVM